MGECCSPCNPCRLSPLLSILNTQRRRRLQQAQRRLRSRLHIFTGRLLHREALPIPPRSGRSRRAGGRKHERQQPWLSIERHNRTRVRRLGTTERLVWPAQRPGTEPETAMDSSSWVILAWRGKRGATEAAVVQGGVAAAVMKAVLLVRLLKDRVAGLAIDLKDLPSSGSGGSESRGSTFGCWRVWQPRRECRSSNSARVGSSSRVRYAI